MPELSLSLGSTVTIYAVADVEKALSKVDGQNGQGLRRVYEQMLEAGPERFISKPRDCSVLDGLVAECPNFDGVLQDLANYVELAAAGKGGINIMPILLAGDPGVGKTHFAKQLAKALDVPFQFVSMGTMTAGWVLSGSAPTWSGARHGKVAETLIEAKFANPVLLLDEVDKSGGDSRYDPHGALLQLLEKETARHFKDEFLDLPVDCSSVFFISTANNVELIPDFLRSRMAIYEVPAPTPEQAAVIAKNIYAGMLDDYEWPFAPELTDATLQAVATVPPREMKKKLLDAMGQAVRKKREVLQPDDIRSTHSRSSRTMGFLA